MALINLLSGAMITTGFTLLLVGVIGLILTRSEEREEERDHECEDQQTGA